jgi:hypothetical protein
MWRNLRAALAAGAHVPEDEGTVRRRALAFDLGIDGNSLHDSLVQLRTKKYLKRRKSRRTFVVIAQKKSSA